MRNPLFGLGKDGLYLPSICLTVRARDPKEIEDIEYELFYQATFKDFNKPLAWHHFSGDSGPGVSFRAIVYLPSKLCVFNRHLKQTLTRF